MVWLDFFLWIQAYKKSLPVVKKFYTNIFTCRKNTDNFISYVFRLDKKSEQGR